jgi:RNA polymerase sigma-70 factor, ECF subfamily
VTTIGGDPRDPAAGRPFDGDPDSAADAPTDEELIARHVGGDPDAFGEIVRRHRDRLWAVALRTLGDREEAADALQDAFVSALRAAATFRGEAKVTTWLHRIVVNACLDRARRRRARPTVPLPSDDRAPAAGDEIGATERATEVQAALATLPIEQAAALVLVDALGFSVDAAAAILGAPTGTVKSRCARGRARLVGILGHRRDGPEGNHPPPAAVPLTTAADTSAPKTTPSREEAEPR